MIAAHIEDIQQQTLSVLGGWRRPRVRWTPLVSRSQPSGCVHALLEPLYHGVSMSPRSRPARTCLWIPLFVDLEGHQTDEPVAAALAELRKRAPFLKLLGSYPAAMS